VARLFLLIQWDKSYINNLLKNQKRGLKMKKFFLFLFIIFTILGGCAHHTSKKEFANAGWKIIYGERNSLDRIYFSKQIDQTGEGDQKWRFSLNPEDADFYGMKTISSDRVLEFNLKSSTLKFIPLGAKKQIFLNGGTESNFQYEAILLKSEDFSNQSKLYLTKLVGRDPSQGLPFKEFE
jgi:hypothetical protein